MRVQDNDITVIIPLYNGEKTIGKVIDAIVNQTKAEYIKEIIVINDGSTDTSRYVVEEYKKTSPIHINLINCENGGVSKARNIGLKNAKTNWVALCDSDDEWFLDKIEHQADVINANPDIDFLGGNHVRKTQKLFFRSLNGTKRITVNDLCLKILPQTSTAIFKTCIFNEIGGYDETQRYAEDGNYFMKIAAKYGYFYDSQQVVTYGDGKSGFGESGLSANIDKMHEGLSKNIVEMKDLGYISYTFYVWSIFVEWVKFLRRKIIVYFRKVGKHIGEV